MLVPLSHILASFYAWFCMYYICHILVPSDSFFFLCIRFMAVRNPDEVGSIDCTSIQPIDLKHFFGEDGKIYGYKNLKVKDCY